jgi:putative tryptophan/tyrosine transport system substrate-binding protein
VGQGGEVFRCKGGVARFGLVASLARPGGNITGAVHLEVELRPKRLELLHELAPTTSVIAILVNPTNRNAESQSRDLQMAASRESLSPKALHLGQLTSRDQKLPPRPLLRRATISVD